MLSWQNLKWNSFNPYWGRALTELKEIIMNWEQAAVDRTEQLGFAQVKDKGIALAFKEKSYVLSNRTRFDPHGPLILIAVHLYGEDVEGFRGFEGELPGGIRFRTSSEDVRARLGTPSKSGGGNIDFGKTWPFWDRYTFPECAVRIQYGGERHTLDVLTVMSLSEVR